MTDPTATQCFLKGTEKKKTYFVPGFVAIIKHPCTFSSPCNFQSHPHSSFKVALGLAPVLYSTFCSIKNSRIIFIQLLNYCNCHKIISFINIHSFIHYPFKECFLLSTKSHFLFLWVSFFIPAIGCKIKVATNSLLYQFKFSKLS